MNGRILLLYVVFIAAVAVLSGCSRNETLNIYMGDGTPVDVTIAYGVAQSPVYTKAAQDEQYEYRVENLYILVFDASGDRVWIEDKDGNQRSSLFDAGADLDITANRNGAGTTTEGKIQFRVPSMSDAEIVGIANVAADQTEITAYSLCAEDLDEITSLDQLKEKSVTLADRSIGRSTHFLMAGYVENSDGGTKIDIAGNGNTAVTLDSLKLRRLDAKVSVNIHFEPDNSGPDQYLDYSFEPQTWCVMQLPAQSYILPVRKNGYSGPWEDPSGGHWDADGEWFDSQELPFEQLTQVEVNNTPYTRGGSFTFYMPENRRHYKKSTDNYSDRDKKNGSDFEFADPNSTYLVMTGSLNYTHRLEDGTERLVNGDVRFIVHLGYSSKNPNDYDTERNGNYIYDITVTGVDDIVMEVKNENGEEMRPGYEGNIAYSDNKVLELDSHYDRCLLEIPISNITENMTWSVRTAFTPSFVYTEGADLSGIDYEWIKFAINVKHGVGHEEYAAYPGEGENKDHYLKDRDYKEIDGIEKPLMNINQLVSYLKYKKFVTRDIEELKVENVQDDHICITAFVDENLSVIDPRDGSYRLDLWKEMVDRENRLMHILTPEENENIFSQDGNSSLMSSLYTFTQKSIRTVFNSEAVSSAWGLESVMETGRLPRGDWDDIHKGTEMDNGRYNTIQWAVGKTWSKIVDKYQHYGLSENYATYACLLRNRDLDGDDIVDIEEIRWYLASIDQLTDIYLGEWALDEYSRLYPYYPKRGDSYMPPSGKVYWHYTSSSYNETDQTAWIFWAEEGASRGSREYSEPNDINGTNYSYRCIRNLGLDITSAESKPEELYYLENDGKPNAEGNYVINLSRMNQKSFRDYKDGGDMLPAHNEQDPDNLPRRRFEVHSGTYKSYPETPDYGYNYVPPGLVFKNNEDWRFYNQNDLNNCPPGYRLPNLREMIIISNLLFDIDEGKAPSPDNFWPQYEKDIGYGYSNKVNYMTCTSFSMNGFAPYTTERDGFIYNAENNNVFLRNNGTEDKGYIRCVRDLE